MLIDVATSLINLIGRIIELLFYPILIGYFCYVISLNTTLKNSFKNNWKHILINIFIILIIGITALYLFFRIEKAYYSYDYAGQWVRTLEIKKMFLSDNPFVIFKDLYTSMNYSEYSYIPAVLALPLMLLCSGTYMQYNIIVFVIFLIPVLVLLQVLYFSYFNYKYLPIGIFLAFYPFYYIVFNAEPDVFSMFFIAYTIYILFIQDNEKITKKEIVAVNVSTFILLFFRRYHLFYVVFMYIVYLLRVIIYYLNNKETVEIKKLVWQTIQTGLYVLIVLVLFFSPYLLRTITNNFSSSYTMFDSQNSKFVYLIKNYSYLISLISLLGLLISIKNKNRGLILTFLNATLICLLFWKIQIFENHHYTLISIQMVMLFVVGLGYLTSKSKIITFVLLLVLSFQSVNIFLDISENPLLASERRTPRVMDTIGLMTDFTDHLHDLTKDGKNVWFATGNAYFDSQICNVVLPDLDRMPNIVSNHVLDIRDKFPDLNEIDYIVISSPTLYLKEDYQKMYDVINYAINFEPEVEKHFIFISEWFYGDYYINVVKRVDNLDYNAKEILYNLMIGYYPDLADDFKYILD